MKTRWWCKIVFAASGLACGGTGPGLPDSHIDDEDSDYYVPLADEDGKTDRVVSRLAFTNACAAGPKLVISAVGDVLLHSSLQRQAYRASDGARTLWKDVEPLFAKAHISYANLEGPAASGVVASGRDARDPGKVYDGSVYSGYPQFNYHPSLLADLVAAGIDIVSTANNHALDRRALGANRTIAGLNAAALKFSGTRTSTASSRTFHTTTSAAGFKIAWLACTFSTNGIRDAKDQVLMCYEDTTEIEGIIRALAKTPGIDAVIVTPHWGNEYEATPSSSQKSLGKKFLNAGALAVIGSHPHVTQPWEKFVTADGRETFIIYSLGNFVSAQSQLARRSTLVLYLGLTRGANGKTIINGVRYVPLTMTSTSAGRSLKFASEAGSTASSYRLTVGMFGRDNRLAPTDPVVTNPECPR
ncbi:MAG: CapA family protein [Deltaproteobacteria bacterium]|nr:CapA family protein [Deltaproteobacteria bacterium]